MGMVAGDNLTVSPIEVPRGNIKNTERDFDAAVYTAARIFNAVALPDDMPDFLKEAIEAKAEQAKISAREAGFVAPEMGNLIDGKTIQERERDKDDEARAYVASIAQDIEQRRQQEREEASYQEWHQTRHTYAGQTMDGEDWHRLLTWFRDPANTAAWEDAMMTETGQSRDEVRQTGGKMKRFYDLMEKDARGTITKDERADFDKLNADKDVKRGVEVQQEIEGLRHSQTAELSEGNDRVWDSTQTTKATSFAAKFDDDTAPSSLSAVQPISLAYREAAAAKPPSPLPTSAQSVSAPAQTI